MKKLQVVLAAVLIGALTVGCSTATETSNEELVKIGVNGTDFRVWDYVKEELAKEGVTLEVVSFGDYVQPNLALEQGEIDINSFQTNIYFQQFIADHNLDLVPIGNTVFAPMGIYSESLAVPSDIEEKGKIAIPNDATNGGRALLLLEEAGIIKLKKGVGSIPTEKDIVENPKQVEIIPMTAQQIPTSLRDVDLGIINSGVAVTAGFSPVDDALYIEDVNTPNAENYYNIFAVRKEDENSQVLNRLVEIYQTEKVKEILADMYGDAQIPLF